MNIRRFSCRRIVFLALTLTFTALAGCERYRHLLRDSDSEVVRSSKETHSKLKTNDNEPESSKILDVQSDAKKSKPFFRGSRLSGALTDEGREIERDLGIH